MDEIIVEWARTMPDHGQDKAKHAADLACYKKHKNHFKTIVKKKSVKSMPSIDIDALNPQYAREYYQTTFHPREPCSLYTILPVFS